MINRRQVALCISQQLYNIMTSHLIINRQWATPNFLPKGPITSHLINRREWAALYNFLSNDFITRPTESEWHIAYITHSLPKTLTWRTGSEKPFLLCNVDEFVVMTNRGWVTLQSLCVSAKYSNVILSDKQEVSDSLHFLLNILMSFVTWLTVSKYHIFCL